ncbi:hypothetical protein Dsin_012001 [Dipteronia sinensis]|uniref:Transposase n=1 Tax=Dipteronia sinensis TaxID=43782 RepID=A0AAE0E7L5_9ROSI|nr:hypothetical protein Dsin_012001 [Dipteronia sinensis]
MVVTAHFIDYDWRLQKRILSFSQITDHTGNSIGRCIEKVLLEWGIDKIFTIIVDNATANANAIGYMNRKLNSWREDGTIFGGKYMHLRCCAHILNLIVSDGLKDLHESVVAIRNAVKYVKSSPSRLDRFKRAVEHEKLGNNGFVVLDVPTRWNSTYLMLESAVKLRKAFERMEEENGHYVNYFKESDNEKRISPPLLNDWENAKVFIQFLSTFYDITLDFIASLHVTSNIYFKSWCTIFNQLTSLSTERDPLVSRMAVSMKQKFDKYWKGLDKTINLLIIAVVLDPRYKFGYVKWRFDAFYGVTQSHSMLCSLKEVLIDLYEYYVTQYGSVNVKSNDDMSSGKSGVPESFYEKEKFKEDSLWGQKQQEEDVSMGKSEVELYLLEACEKLNDKFDLLAWWKNCSVKFPILSMIAKDVFSMPISIVASESAFSTGGRILDPFRSSLTPKIVESLILTGNWLSASCPIAEPCVAEEHAKDDDTSIQLLEYYPNVETGEVVKI